MTERTEIIAVVTTFASEEEAVEAAHRLTRKKLAACVQIEPIRSFYRWEDQDRDEPEWRATAKTSRARLTEIIADIRSAHTYETPEILVFQAVRGDADYLRWVERNSGG